MLRRGPSSWVRLSLWHTDSDTFEHGQWMGGRIYERRSDLSPDGRLFAYFARKSGAPRPGQQADTWVAVSRPPWLTALALWWVGGTYCAGACFPDRQSLWVGGSQPPDQGTLPRSLHIAPAPPHLDGTGNWTDRIVWHSRLLRGGWTPAADEPTPPNIYDERWERRHPREAVTLLMRQTYSGYPEHPYGGPYVMRYALRHEPSGDVADLGRATWADWDQRGRLILARHGRRLHRQPDGAFQELADFNDQVPDPAPSPPEAHTWP